MGKRWWSGFAICQFLGVALSLYAMRVEVGVGAWQNLVWVPPALLLSPGILMGIAAGSLDVGQALGTWHGTPLFAATVLINAGSWVLVTRVVQALRRKST